MKFKQLLLIGGVVSLMSACGGSSTSTSPTTTENIDKKDFFVQVESSSILSAELVEVFDSSSLEIASDLNKMFSLPERDITIVFKDCGEENAFYDPNASQVVMCYELLGSLLGSGTYGIDDAISIFMFVFWHEIGHSFVDHYQIAVLGSEEDAVDAISAVIMIADTDTPEEKIEAARGIVLAGDYLNSSGALNWAGIHSVGPQRLANLVCWAWGAEPSITNELDVQNIVTQLVESGRDCQSEFQEKVSNVDTLIGKYTKE